MSSRSQLIHHPRLNLKLPQGLRDRNPVMPVTHEVFVSNLHQLNRRQYNPAQTGNGDADPTPSIVTLQRVEVCIEILAPAFAAHDLLYLGDRTGAVRQYETCVQALSDELGIPPQNETTELYQAILRGDLPDAPIKVTKPTTPLESRPVLRVPVMPTPFIGRRTEVEQIKALLCDSDQHLVTLIGPGGSGKTSRGNTNRQPNWQH